MKTVYIFFVDKLFDGYIKDTYFLLSGGKLQVIEKKINFDSGLHFFRLIDRRINLDFRND